MSDRTAYFALTICLQGCGDKGEKRSHPEIDCSAFTEQDFAEIYVKDVLCVDAHFCSSAYGTWEECIDAALPDTEVVEFNNTDDTWDQDIACHCAKSWENSRLEAEAGLYLWECDSGNYGGAYFDCPDDWDRYVAYSEVE